MFITLSDTYNKKIDTAVEGLSGRRLIFSFIMTHNLVYFLYSVIS